MSSSQSKPFEIKAGSPAVVLAPMEGVIDAPMRHFLSVVSQADACVSEFLRISQDVPPKKIFLRHVPELAQGGQTLAGTPVQVQLLGGDPEKLAEAALVACEAGAWGVDLNFGCPAPTVNRHDGGATLLKYPDRIRAIVEAVRKAVPSALPVSAKMRLGWDSIETIHLNAERAAEGGASWITIHGRTKVQGYAPPAYWKPIGDVRKRLGIPVVANGEIWTFEDFLRCRDVTGCEHFMLGRGAMANVHLPTRIQAELRGQKLSRGFSDTLSLEEWGALFERFAQVCDRYSMGPGYTLRRIKQWAGMVSVKFPLEWIHPLKRTMSLEEAFAFLKTFKGV